jgi:transcriptional regulator with XRE-family HTH domain
VLRPRSIHSDEYKLLAQMLREARTAAGLTQREVASRLEKSPSYAHKVENAEREMNVVELMDYCTALDVPFVTFAKKLHAAVHQSRQVAPFQPEAPS